MMLVERTLASNVQGQRHRSGPPVAVCEHERHQGLLVHAHLKIKRKPRVPNSRLLLAMITRDASERVLEDNLTAHKVYEIDKFLVKN
jgi:hypothetical protein